MLNVPVIDRTGERLGVVQVLNKRGGRFTQVDIRRLKAFSSGIAVALENARLFSDVLALKNYNESILKSLSNGVVTLDRQCVIVKVNEAAQRILGLSSEALVDRSAQQVFDNLNAWITRSLEFVERMGAADYHADTDLRQPDGGAASANGAGTGGAAAGGHRGQAVLTGLIHALATASRIWLRMSWRSMSSTATALPLGQPIPWSATT